jgi:hypothetical protein
VLGALAAPCASTAVLGQLIYGRRDNPSDILDSLDIAGKADLTIPVCASEAALRPPRGGPDHTFVELVVDRIVTEISCYFLEGMSLIDFDQPESLSLERDLLTVEHWRLVLRHLKPCAASQYSLRFLRRRTRRHCRARNKFRPANAITIAGRGAIDGEIYVFGKPVCPQCAGFIIQSGVKRVIAEKPDTGTKSRWAKLGLLAEEILREAGIDVDLIPRTELLSRVLPARKSQKPPKDAPLIEWPGPDGIRPDQRSRYHLLKDKGSGLLKADRAEGRLSEKALPSARRAGHAIRAR